MFLKFFSALKNSKIPVSLREFLTFLDALQTGLVAFDIDAFYYLVRQGGPPGEVAQKQDARILRRPLCEKASGPVRASAGVGLERPDASNRPHVQNSN